MELKTQFIQAITEEMGRLNGEKFERLCTYFMSMVTETECIQVGHNLYQKPVG